MLEIKEIFLAFKGGYLGPGVYFYINKIGNQYEFRYGDTEAGIFLKNEPDNSFLSSKLCNQEEYNKFITELKNMTINWNSNYSDNAILDGTQWYIKSDMEKIDYYGSNAYPNNFEAVMAYLKKEFK